MDIQKKERLRQALTAILDYLLSQEATQKESMSDADKPQGASAASSSIKEDIQPASTQKAAQ